MKSRGLVSRSLLGWIALASLALIWLIYRRGTSSELIDKALRTGDREFIRGEEEALQFREAGVVEHLPFQPGAFKAAKRARAKRTPKPAPKLPPLPKERECTRTHFSSSTGDNEKFLRDSLYVRNPVCETGSRVSCPQLTSHSRRKSTTVGSKNTTTTTPTKSKGRVLVIYVLPLVAGEDRDVGRLQEWNNFRFFLRQGYVPPNVSTELYDGVDFVFARTHGHYREIVECSRKDNMRFVWVPTAPCDLCSQARLLKWLGYRPPRKGRLHLPSWKWKSIILLNSGVRGPFTASGSSHWIDVISMAGQPSRPFYFSDDVERFRTITAASFSWEYKFHFQSYFSMVPLGALEPLYQLYKDTCTWDTKIFCIFLGELFNAQKAIQGGDIQVFASLYNVTVNSRSNLTALGEKYYDKDKPNPTSRFLDPCLSIFVKYGGNMLREEQLSEESLKVVRRLSVAEALKPVETPVDLSFLDDSKCPFLL